MYLPNPGTILLIILLTQTIPLQAVGMLRQPVAITPLPGDAAKSCIELEREITRITPLSYSYKPHFYNNPYQGAAVMAGTVSSPAFYLYSAFDYFLDYRESRRILSTQDRLEILRRLKAEKHCFES